MSHIEDIARNAMITAHSDLVKARRLLLLVAGLLALIHMLTVYPYLHVFQEISQIEPRLKTDVALLSQLDSEINRLRTAEQNASLQIEKILTGATREMMNRFERLGRLVEQVRSTDRSAADILANETPTVFPYESGFPGTPFPSSSYATQPAQVPRFLGPNPVQWPVRADPSDLVFAIEGTEPAAPVQQDLPPEPMPPTRYPFSGSQADHRFAAPDRIAPFPDVELIQALEALDANASDADARMNRYAREEIVAAVYERAQSRWLSEVRPEYLRALTGIEQTARQLADQANVTLPEEARALLAAANALADARETINTIEISPNHHVDEALGTDWWRTVPGKGQYAEALTGSIEAQMQSITETASAAMNAIEVIRERQQTLHTALVKQREQLENQFNAQNKQLATLSGASGVLPIDLASFIQFFPLVIGVLLGLLLMRLSQARHDGAQATEALAMANPEDRMTRRWLARRVLGAERPAGPMLVTTVSAIAACLWVIFSAMQLTASSIKPPVSSLLTSVVGITLILAGAAWDLWGIRRLDRAQRL
jgi:hypothetical protein